MPISFEQVIPAWEPRLYRYAFHILRNEEDARDALQETFLRAYRAQGSFRGEASLETWLYQLTKNACVDELRRRRRTVPSIPIENIQIGTMPAATDIDWDPLTSLVRNTQREEIAAAIDLIPSPYREVLILREIEGHTYREIATRLGCSVGTVRSRLARGRSHFRKLWKKGSLPKSPK